MESGERHDKRSRILEAALVVFSRKGVIGTRIADIAAEAGIAYGLVYHYFKNKEEVLSTIFTERWGGITDRLEQAAKEDGDIRSRLLGVVEVFIGAYHAKPPVVELLTMEFTRVADILEPIHLDQVSGAYAVVRRIIEQGQRDGKIRKDLNAAILMLNFVGGLQLILQSEALGVYRPPEEFQARGGELLVDTFLDGVRLK